VKGSRLLHLLPSSIIVMLLLGSLQAEAGIVSGSMQLSFNDTSGLSQYTILYKHPSIVTTGSNFTITLTFVVNNLQGLKSYLQDYTLTVIMPITAHHTIYKSVSVTADKIRYLYPGGRWGPLNVTIPINESSAGLSPGQLVSANVTVGFVGDVYYLAPVNYFYPESGQFQAGQLMVQDIAPSFPTIPVVLIAAGGTLLLTGVLLRRR
jgi:hypothetical protein